MNLWLRLEIARVKGSGELVGYRLTSHQANEDRVLLLSPQRPEFHIGPKFSPNMGEEIEYEEVEVPWK